MAEMFAYHTMSRSTANIAEEAFHQLKISFTWTRYS